MKEWGNNETVLVIGAGIIGIACAHYLSKAGRKVIVIDKGTIGSACSFGNCGHILPSHVLPLNSKDALKTGIASLLNASSPFRVKPQLAPGFWQWMWQFTRHCTDSHIRHAAISLEALLTSSYNEYAALIESEDLDVDWQENGLLYLFEQTKNWEAFGRKNDWLANEIGVKASPISANELTGFDPALSENLAGGYYYPKDASLRPETLIQHWPERLKSEGVEFIKRCALISTENTGKKITRVTTTKGSILCADVVIATGAMSRALSKQFGLMIPVEPGKGYALTTERPSSCPRASLVLPEHSIAVTPFSNALRIGSFMEFVGFDGSLPARRIRQLRNGVAPFLRAPLPPDNIETWFGWRPMTWDSLPIIGRAPHLENTYIATGHQMIGLMSAPATGKLIAEQIAGTAPHIQDTPFSPARFCA